MTTQTAPHWQKHDTCNGAGCPGCDGLGRVQDYQPEPRLEPCVSVPVSVLQSWKERAEKIEELLMRREIPNIGVALYQASMLAGGIAALAKGEKA